MKEILLVSSDTLEQIKFLEAKHLFYLHLFMVERNRVSAELPGPDDRVD